MTEFTGERVIPGQVNADLWAEHIARYAFASQFAAGTLLLDAGCGTGYGCSALARAGARVVGIDLSAEAIAYARENSAEPRIEYLQASANALPFAPETFDLITAFEVIEHLPEWRESLAEGSRVLQPGGLFIVSTPNRLYYAESRAQDGPNPYHVHEFEHEEFRAALAEFFPYSAVLLQNRLESFAFHGTEAAAATEIQSEKTPDSPAEANFFIGICGKRPLPELRTFVYIPRTANLLREREQHIQLLEQELALTKRWLEQSIADHSRLQQSHEELGHHLEEKNRWAQELENLCRAAQQRIVELQSEFEKEQANSAAVARGYALKVSELEQENIAKTEWALETERRLSANLAAHTKQLSEAIRKLESSEATSTERMHRAAELDAQLKQLGAQIEMIRSSRWVRMGRRFGIGPEVTGPK